jgi:hypothetical protein
MSGPLRTAGSAALTAAAEHVLDTEAAEVAHEDVQRVRKLKPPNPPGARAGPSRPRARNGRTPRACADPQHLVRLRQPP